MVNDQAELPSRMVKTSAHVEWSSGVFSGQVDWLSGLVELSYPADWMS